MCYLSQTSIKLTLLAALFNLSWACLITNCPRGGKRDGSENGSIENKIADLGTCTPCGPNKLGVCVDRDICCGKHMGCLMGSSHTRICRRVRDFKDSCLSAFSSCGEDGLCVAKDVCCSKKICRIDESCKAIPVASFNYGLGPEFLNKFAFRYPLDVNNFGNNRPEAESAVVSDMLEEPQQESILFNYNFRPDDSS